MFQKADGKRNLNMIYKNQNNSMDFVEDLWKFYCHINRIAIVVRNALLQQTYINASFLQDQKKHLTLEMFSIILIFSSSRLSIGDL